MYSSCENLDEQICIHRPSCDKTSLKYFIEEKLTKKFEARNEPYLEKSSSYATKRIFESNQSYDAPKEVEQAKQPEQVDEPK